MRANTKGRRLVDDSVDVRTAVKTLPNLKQELQEGGDTIAAKIEETGDELTLRHDFSEHEREILVAGGLLSHLRRNGADSDSGAGAES